MNLPWTNRVRLSTVVFTALLLALSACGEDASTQTIPVAGPDSSTISPSTSMAPSTSSSTATSTTAADTTTTTRAVETTTALPPLQGLAYEEFITDLPFPIAVVPGSQDSEDLLVALKGGQVLRATPAGEPRTVLDISDRVRDEGERGLLGIAVHPADATRFFAHYSDESGDTTVSEFAVGDDGTIDPASEEVLFTADQPAGNHNGGWIQFGPDRMLYLGLGDGGGADDQFGNGQRDNTPLAGLVRIDVDSGDAEKFAMGLRNPWRFWIDGELVYIADVGQNAYEEVSVAPLQPGLNYGWSIMEGMHCFPADDPCDEAGLTLPVIEVEHGDAGTCSITGGVVSDDPAIPELRGHYFYSDYCGGWLRSFRYADGEAVDQNDWTESTGVPGQIASFGSGPDGRVYVTTTTDVLVVVPVR